jgi:hypothetical protein
MSLKCYRHELAREKAGGFPRKIVFSRGTKRGSFESDSVHFSTVAEKVNHTYLQHGMYPKALDTHAGASSVHYRHEPLMQRCQIISVGPGGDCPGGGVASRGGGWWCFGRAVKSTISLMYFTVARATKNNEKKRSAVKILHSPFQITS